MKLGTTIRMRTLCWPILRLTAASGKCSCTRPKIGIFYVLDRATGELISAKPYTHITWASGVDMKTGRPVELASARYSGGKPDMVIPGPLGAHSWQPMAFSPLTGLVYIPIQDAGFPYQSDADFKMRALAYDNGVDFAAAGMPQDPKIKKAIIGGVTGRLVALNRCSRNKSGTSRGRRLGTAECWRQPVIWFSKERRAEIWEEAYLADKGTRVWTYPIQTGAIAGPVSYTVRGEQYVAILAGWGGVFPLAAGEIALKAGRVRNVSRMIVFRLGGRGVLPPLPEIEAEVLNPPRSTANAATVHRGEGIYQRYCSTCHGDVAVSGGVLPDLRYSSTLTNDQWFQIVLGGLLQPNGMVSFGKEISRGDAAAIRAYVIFRRESGFGGEQEAGRRCGTAVRVKNHARFPIIRTGAVIRETGDQYCARILRLAQRSNRGEIPPFGRDDNRIGSESDEVMRP